MGQPILGATVTIRGFNITATSDSSGRVVLEGVPVGTWTLSVRRMGFRTIEREITVSGNALVQLSPGTLVLPPAPLPLDTAVVTGTRQPNSIRYLVDNGFYARAKEHYGEFIGPEEVKRYYPSVVTDLLRHLRGFEVRPNPHYGQQRGLGGGDLDTREWLIESRRKSSFRGECPVLFFVDGVRQDRELDDLINLVNVETIVAVEAYNGMGKMPVTFNMTGSACGVIAVWTQRY